jgi:hypothetical protein
MADDTFQESMSRLSAHLSTRRPTHALPDLLPPPRPFRVAWPYVLLAAIVGAGAIGYPYYQWLVQDDAPHPATSHVAAAIPAPTPVLAAVAVAPEAAPPPPPVSRPAKTEAVAVDMAAAIPAPPQSAPPVTLPAPASTTAPEPEIALSRSEIVELQKRLASLGLNPGPIDGVIGPRTTASAQKYQAKVGRAVTGKVDRGLLALLRRDPDASPNLQARTP